MSLPILRLVPLLAALALPGCSGTCFHTTMRMTTDTSVLGDGSPLQEMTVTPGCCEQKIALIDIDGVLLNARATGLSSAGENPVEMLREKLDTIERRGCYRAVVLRINSPGGGVTASDIMRRDLMAFKARTSLPVVACLMDVGTGGAYFLATGCDVILAHPTTVTGGLGVLLNVYDMNDTLNQINIIQRTIRAGQLADVGSPVAVLDEEGERVLQEMADRFHSRFRNLVSEARGLSPEEAELFDGRIFAVDRALELGLIDRAGYVDDAIETARQLGNAPGARAVILHRQKDPARTPYAITPNVPRSDLLPLSIPGLERSRLPTFLYMWQPDPTLEKWGGR